jgi:FSR family fosmidomycin resistance protein-like MFS transporter
MPLSFASAPVPEGVNVTPAAVDVESPRTAYAVLAAISFSHLLNDTLQSLLPSIYPVLKSTFDLSFAQVGMMTLALMLTASVLQPVVGLVTDRRPVPLALAAGMTFTLIGLLLLSTAWTFPLLLLAAAFVGVGSSVFHPESSRVARLASGGRHGLAQSVFQVGGNAGSAIGPLIAAFLIAPHGQRSILWCALLALAGIALTYRIGLWQRANHTEVPRARRARGQTPGSLPQRRVAMAIVILAALIFSKYFYLASLSSYFTFYLMTKFGLSVQAAQLHLFAFLAAVAVGTILGGPIGDRIGRKPVIWASILGVLPFSLVLPGANLFWTGVLAVIIGLILASAFSAIVVYAQELVPGRVGLISGVFFGFAFGMGGIGAAVLGQLADRIGIESVYGLCAFLPAIGLLAAFLPNVERPALSDRLSSASSAT